METATAHILLYWFVQSKINWSIKDEELQLNSFNLTWRRFYFKVLLILQHWLTKTFNRCFCPTRCGNLRLSSNFTLHNEQLYHWTVPFLSVSSTYSKPGWKYSICYITMKILYYTSTIHHSATVDCYIIFSFIWLLPQQMLRERGWPFHGSIHTPSYNPTSSDMGYTIDDRCVPRKNLAKSSLAHFDAHFASLHRQFFIVTDVKE